MKVKSPLGRPRHRRKVNIIQVSTNLLRSLNSFSFLLSLSLTFYQTSTLIFSSVSDGVRSEQVALAVATRQQVALAVATRHAIDAVHTELRLRAA